MNRTPYLLAIFLIAASIAHAATWTAMPKPTLDSLGDIAGTSVEIPKYPISWASSPANTCTWTDSLGRSFDGYTWQSWNGTRCEPAISTPLSSRTGSQQILA